MAIDRVARRPPTNSLGRPWEPGQTATCTRCGWSADDRDDCRTMPTGCPCHPSAPHRGPCAVVYSPPEHHEAIRGAVGLCGFCGAPLDAAGNRTCRCGRRTQSQLARFAVLFAALEPLSKDAAAAAEEAAREVRP